VRVLPALLLLTACATRPAEVRVAFDANVITDIRAHGLADRAARRRVTADDPVRVASVSKTVVALGVLRLVEAGQLDLDRDVSDYLGWRLRNPAYPDTPVTLRLLLSHKSSLSDEADYAIPLGKTLRETIADPRAWDSAHAPGGWFHYTNLNFPVIAASWNG
jgi:CubicO group peptidase (beta-lactamase class C family)